MKSQQKLGLLVVIALLGAVIAIAPAQAQSGSRISVNVPFDFVVGNSALKAGAYRIERLENGILALNSLDGQGQQFALTDAGGSSASQNGEPYLVFTRYGNEAFLNTVVFSMGGSYDLRHGSKEKELIATQASGEPVALTVLPAR